MEPSRCTKEEAEDSAQCGNPFALGFAFVCISFAGTRPACV